MTSCCFVHGDCVSIPWEGDVLITDPPYSAHVHKNATSQSVGGGARHRDLAFDHLSTELRLWVCGLAAKVARWSVIFSDIEGAHLWHEDLKKAGATYIRTIPWVRWSMPQLSGDRPPQGCELLVIAYGKTKGKKRWNGPGNLTHLAHTCLRGEGKHKCEKPLDMMLDLVSWFSDEGETVLDPLAGSGTTGMASGMLGRHFQGAEQDEKWANYAADRLRRGGPTTPRDIDRHAKWLESRKTFEQDKVRRDENTARTRARLEEVRR